MNSSSEQTAIVLKESDFIKQNGEFIMTALELGQRLGYKNPFRSIKKLYYQYEKWIEVFKRGVPNRYTPGGKQEVLAFSEIGIYFLALKANTEKSNDFALGIAKFIQNIRKGDIQIVKRVEQLEGNYDFIMNRLRIANIETGNERKRWVCSRRSLNMNQTQYNNIKRLLGKHYDYKEICDILDVRLTTVNIVVHAEFLLSGGGCGKSY